MTVSAGDGVSAVLVQPSIFRGPNQPTNGVQVGDLWEDTSVGGAPVLKQCSSISPITFIDVGSGGGGGSDGVNLLVVNGGAATISTTLTLSNSNNVSFGLAGGVITATATFAGGGGGGIAVAAGTQTATTNTVVFANSNGLTFGMSGSSQITGSYTVPTQTAFVFSNSNNVSFGTNGSTVTATASFNQSVQTQNSVNVLGSSGNISFANSNGITFGGNNSTVTASHNGLTSQSNQALSGSNGSFTFQTASFGNSNGLSFYTTNGSVVASYTVPTVPAQTAYVFSNSNNVSFGTAGSTVTATASFSQTNQTVGVYAVSNTTGASSSSTVDARSLSFQGAGVASVGMSNGSVVISVPSGGGAGDGYNIIAAGTQTATSAGTVSFANSNGISFGLSGSTQLTASYTVPSTAGLLSAINVSAGTTSNNGSAFVFSNSNGISFGLNGSTVTGSHNGLTTQTVQTQSNVQGIQVSNTTYRTGDVLFQNANGISFGSSGANGVSASYTVPTVTNSSWTVSDAGTSGTVGRLAFTNLNGVTLSLSTGAGGSHTIVGSHNALTSQSNQAVSGSNGSFTFQTLTFGNLNGLSFYTSNGSIVGSYTDGGGGGGGGIALANSQTTYTSGTANLVVAGGAMTIASTTGQSFNFSVPATSSLVGAGGISISTNGSTISISNGTMSAYAVSNTTQSSSGTINPSAMSFQGAGGVSVGVSNGSVVISGAAGGGGGGATQSFFWGMVPGFSTAVSQIGNGTIAVYPVAREGAFSASRADIYASLSVSSSSNSSHAGALSVYAGIYTRNGSTLSLASSGSQSYQWTNTSNNSLSLVASLRRFSMPFDVNYTGGDIWMAVMTRSSTTNANWFTASNVLQSAAIHSGQIVGLIGEATNVTRGQLGFGRFSASSTALPGSMAFTQISGNYGATASASRLMPNIYFQNFTV